MLDRTFNAVPERALERLRLFGEEFGDFRFHLEIHPAYLNDDLRKAFASSPKGHLHLEVGLQTTCAESLSACRRGGTPEVIWENFEYLCSCRNLEIHVDLLAGLPGLTLNHLMRDVTAAA